METYVQLIVLGLLHGGIYALAAFGLSIVFGVSGVLNLAHGEFLMLGGMGVFALRSLLGGNPFVLALLVLPAAFVAGYLFERGLIRPLAARDDRSRVASAVLVTLGAALFIEDATAFVLRLSGADYDVSVPYTLPSLFVGDIVISYLRLLVLVLITLLTVALGYYLKVTYTGMALRATTQNRRGALLAGVDTGRLSSITFGIGAVLAAAAGVFEVVLASVDPSLGLPVTLKYLCIIVLGGLGSLMGALVGGAILGLTEQFVGFYSPAWGQTAAFFILVVVLLVRPRGLFGTY